MTSTKVLVIEDNPFAASVAQAMLGYHGFDVLLAHDGIAGINSWQDAKPDIIITDLALPGIDGVDLIRVIRSTNNNIPIIAISGMGPENGTRNLEMAKNMGADIVMEKPMRAGPTISAIKSLLKLPAELQTIPS